MHIVDLPAAPDGRTVSVNVDLITHLRETAPEETAVHFGTAEVVVRLSLDKVKAYLSLPEI